MMKYEVVDKPRC